MFKDNSIEEFLAKTASKDPVPGGGSVAALCGAAACALAAMVASLTVDNPKYREAGMEMKDLVNTGSEYIEFFTGQMDADANAFNSVLEAYRMPKSNEEQRADRARAIQQSLKQAAEVPMAVAEKAFGTMKMIETVVKKGNRQAVTDGAIAAMMARTAVLAALYNVEINLKSIKDDGYRERMEIRVEELRGKTAEAEGLILSMVKM